MQRREFLAGAAASAACVAPLRAAERDILTGFQAGINLGTWISQYNRKSPEFDARVRESDIRQIASWGMDHIRLPIDYDFFETEPGQYSEERLGYADRAIEWARQNKLNIILDLHHAPGYTFMNAGRNELFKQESMQQRFLDIWAMFARRYRSHGEHLLFELLNEVVEATPAEWNGLVARAVRTIRNVDPNRWVVVGGLRYNSIDALKDIAILDDPRIVYTFHFYSPILFTHQKAGWTKVCVAYDQFTKGQQVPYPGEIPRLAEFIAATPQYKGEAKYVGRNINRDWMRAAVAPAVRFLQANRKPLYCGEYGVIRHASNESKERWYSDFCDLLREQRIGRAAWSYKDGSFGFVDRGTSQPYNQSVVKLASRRW